ncbi:anti-anti-sigma factor [Micromonospora purpureochromogenes]|uniref:Anti-anti-sigma factor n=2 Tax=Micromonospora purpureochromogenes TaxID=47872 RepID=A0A1C4YUR7_9ACTN|nr:anti-anti-sigma factor [Micromonospora purpureochromogenes]
MSTELPYDRSRGADGDVPPGPPVMSLHCEHEGPLTVVSVHGEVDMSNAHLLVDLVAGLARHPAPRVVLDLSGVRFVDLHAVRALIEADRLLREAAGGLALRRPPRCVSRLLHLTATAHLFGVDEGPVPGDAPWAGPAATGDRVPPRPATGALSPNSRMDARRPPLPSVREVPA